MASPRRSPRFKLSPKPKLPKKPRRPKRVKNPAEDSVRQTNYQVELAAWEAAKVEHENKKKAGQADGRLEGSAQKRRRKGCPAPGRAPGCSRPASSG